MPRRSRNLSPSGLYHITIRGINRQQLFEDSDDFASFLASLSAALDRHPFLLHAYCLMGNHVHLLLECPDHHPPGDFMKALEDSFVYHYNQRYGRCGILFQNRFHSVPITSEAAFLAALRYIHQNPMRAGIEATPGTYPWSSFHDYFHPAGCTVPLCRDRVMYYFPTEASLHTFLRTPANASETVQFHAGPRLDDALIIRLILELAACSNLTEVRQLPKADRNRLIGQLHEQKIPFVTIGRMLCLSPSSVGKIAKEQARTCD